MVYVLGDVPDDQLVLLQQNDRQPQDEINSARVVVMSLVQSTLFPVASIEEIERAKQIVLVDYRKAKLIVEDLERNNSTHIKSYREYKKLTHDVERAVALIMNDRIRKLIINRCLKGVSRPRTIELFNDRCERTIDRNIYEGIESIANTFKIWQE